MTHTNYCRDHSVKANNFSRFSHSACAMPCNILSITALSLDVDIMNSFYQSLFMWIDGLVPTVAHYIRLLSRLRNTNIQNEKNKQIETSFFYANTVKFVFISVQLDSGQFQENSQEYLRWA